MVAADGVQRGHKLHPAVLVQRVMPGTGPERTDELPVLAQRELRVGEQADGFMVLLGQLQEHRLGRWRPRQAREMRFAPQRQRMEQARFRALKVIAVEVFTAIVQGITE